MHYDYGRFFSLKLKSKQAFSYPKPLAQSEKEKEKKLLFWITLFVFTGTMSSIVSASPVTGHFPESW